MITADDLGFAYDGTPVLAGVRLRADDGRVTGLIGPNGSGKSTLLRLLYGALRPQGVGETRIDGEPVQRLAHRERARRIAVVAQESSPALPMTVTDMVLLGRSPHRSSLQSYRDVDHTAATRALQEVGMGEHAGRSFLALSGGERQRVLIARALAQEATHLLLDEPTNHLDVRYQHEVLDLLRRLGSTATVVVLHDLNLAARYCDDVVLLDQGSVVASGSTREVLTPQVLQPVYRVRVRLLEDDDCVQLLMRPQERVSRAPAADAPG